MDFFNLLFLFTVVTSASSHTHIATETEMFAIPVTPNMFNWTYQEFDEQYKFHAALKGKPGLPLWLRYIYSARHHSGFIFGTPPLGAETPILLEIIGLNRQDYETRQFLINIKVKPRHRMAKHEVEMKIDNLNVEDLLDEHRMIRLKDIFKSKLWSESSEDLYATFLSSAIDLGARLPLKPNDGEGLVVRLGSEAPLSGELRRLREEVRPLGRLGRLGSCPRDYKRTTRERLFRDAGLTLDWCSFELYNTVYKERSTELLEYLTEIPTTTEKTNTDRDIYMSRRRTAPKRSEIPSRSYIREFLVAILLPIVFMLVTMITLTGVVCFHYAGITDPEFEGFIDSAFDMCLEYKECRNKSGHKSENVELCRYGAGNTDQPLVPDNTSNKSLIGISPNSSVARPYSPKCRSNLSGNYNRPLPPPYSGNSLHRRKQSPDQSALEESLKLLNEANITSIEYVPILKEPTIKPDDYVPLKADIPTYVPDLKTGFNRLEFVDDLDVVGDYGLNGAVGPNI